MKTRQRSMGSRISLPQGEKLGRVVRKIWVRWAKTQPNLKPSWLSPWEELSDADKEVDVLIGCTLFSLGRIYESRQAPHDLKKAFQVADLVEDFDKSFGRFKDDFEATEVQEYLRDLPDR